MKYIRLASVTLFQMLLIICFGCGRQGIFKSIPDQLTKEGKVCVLNCLSESIECDERCRQIGDIFNGGIETGGGISTEDLLSQCYADCDQKLKDCYSACE